MQASELQASAGLPTKTICQFEDTEKREMANRKRDKQTVKWAQIKTDRCDGVVGVGGGSEVKTKKVENKKQKKKMPSEEGLVAGQSAWDSFFLSFPFLCLLPVPFHFSSKNHSSSVRLLHFPAPGKCSAEAETEEKR